MKRIAAAVALVAIVTTGCAGKTNPATATPAKTTVEITMTDMAFHPGVVTVPKGQPVVLRFVNHDSVQHEAIIGDNTVQDEFSKRLKADGSRSDSGTVGDSNGGTGDDPSKWKDDHSTWSGKDTSGGESDRAVWVNPGKTAEITTTFATAGTLIIGCHEPGHYEGGMKAILTVN